ncbi:hypothetical protein [Caulobacter sp. UC70_42]|uniref:hypothetical protein n=1 Tax=Caulobacter sp. UC70_42 TaxID=3374551 RepID=UPI003757F855
MSDMSNVETAVQLARIEGKIDLQTLEMGHLKQAIADQKSEVAAMRAELDTKANRDDLNDKVSKDDFGPVKTIVFGLVGLILIAVVGALIALVLPGHVG